MGRCGPYTQGVTGSWRRGSLREWAHCHLGAPSPAGKGGRDFPGSGVAPPPPLSLPFPPGLYILHPPSDPRSPPTSSLAPTSRLGPPSGSEPTIILHHRLWFGASSHTFYFSFCTAAYSFQMCLLTEVTFLVLLTCSFLLIYFATPPGSYSPSPHPPPPILSAHRNHFFLFFLSSFG